MLGRMKQAVGSRTIDGARALRALFVGLDAQQEDACRRAIVPVEIVKAETVLEACSSMSTVLPLVVVTDEGISETDRSTLSDMATACGAELVLTPRTVAVAPLNASLLDALRRAERRRLGIARTDVSR